MRDWVIASEKDWCFQTIGARWQFVSAFACVSVIGLGVLLG